MWSARALPTAEYANAAAQHAFSLLTVTLKGKSQTIDDQKKMSNLSPWLLGLLIIYCVSWQF